jgi:cation diffusion facilitator CzcD-associated flavoprotein CzcO
VEHVPGCSLLVIDAGSDIGGTWAEERLYPNLLSQNSYGMYEFSDLPLSQVVPEETTGVGQQFIAGWKINRYLHAWTEKWKLKNHIRLNWKVSVVSVDCVECLTKTRLGVSAAWRPKSGSSRYKLGRVRHAISGLSAIS